MKRVFILTVLLAVFYCAASAGTIYVATTGNDVTGNGAIGNPYASLSKAASVAVSSDIIHINAGNYILTAGVNIPVGVSIEGADSSTVKITANYTSTSQSNAALMLISTTDGTNGNQHISGITLDGNNLTAYQAIITYGRSNVKIYNCAIRNFANAGLLFNGTYRLGAAPTILASGNEIYNCTIDNCADRTIGLAGGGIGAGGYSGMLIHDNISRSGGRAVNHNGNNFSANGTTKASGLKMYNNKFYRPSTDGSLDNSYILEMWDSQGGMEIYNNEFHGGTQAIDLAGNDDKSKGVYDYGYWIHDNTFDSDSAFVNLPIPLVVAIDVEGSSENVIIERNHFNHYSYGIMITLGNVSQKGIRNTNIRNNLFENIGSVNVQYSADIFVNGGGRPETYGKISSLNIYNNTHSSLSIAGLMVVGLKAVDTLIGLNYVNNIVTGVRSHGYITIDGNAGYIDSFVIRNNISYNNARSNEISYENGAVAPVHYTYIAPIKSDPKLNANFTLQSGSPAIDSGYNVGLPYNGPAPDIGALESAAIIYDTTGRVMNRTAKEEKAKVDSIKTANKYEIAEEEIVKVNAIMPNPTTGLFSVKLSESLIKANVMLVDAKGNVIQKSIQSGNKLRFDISNYPAGMYVVQITQGDKTFSFKILKQ